MSEVKLKKGQVIKNYKELCIILNVECSSGNAKKAHIKEFERYCNFHKEGNKYIVDEVFDSPKPKQYNIGKRINNGGNNTKYDTLMDDIVINYLVEYSRYNFTLLNFLEQNRITTKKYRNLYILNHEELAKSFNMSKGLIQTYKEKSRTILKCCLQTSLTRLERKGIITYEETYMYNDRYKKYIIADDFLKHIIKSKENEVSVELDIKHNARAFKNNNENIVNLTIKKLSENNIFINKYWKIYNITKTHGLIKQEANKNELINRIQDSIINSVIKTKTKNKYNNHRTVDGENGWGTIIENTSYKLPKHIKDIQILNKKMFY